MKLKLELEITPEEFKELTGVDKLQENTVELLQSSYQQWFKNCLTNPMLWGYNKDTDK